MPKAKDGETGDTSVNAVPHRNVEDHIIRSPHKSAKDDI